MYHVYLLRSTEAPSKTYVGFTSLAVEERLTAHNAGSVPYTSRYRPWDLVAVVSVPSKEKALALETYFKSGSGHAFAHKHLW
jgi:putative endonuclease